ncbi:MAG: sodium/solute symporter [Planctomycetaceae bacterium]|nr:sodium/solute symporter [Planctomycetaceae bacterium]
MNLTLTSQIGLPDFVFRTCLAADPEAVASASSSVPLQWLDVLILVGSVILITAFGMWIGRKEENTNDYYLAGKTVAWWAIAGSIFGTNVSSHHLVGMMGAGLKEGFAQANYEFGAIFGLMMLCYFFLPFYRHMGVYTLSEYLGRRFDDRSLLVYSITNMAFLLIQMVGTMILGALTIEKLTAGSPYAVSYPTAIWLLSIVSAAYTFYGGLKADIFNDVVQSVLLLIGSGLLAVLAIWHPNVGGLSGLLTKEPDKFHVFFAADHPVLPWSGVLSGLMVLHMYYWGTNQFIVQRTLGARSDWDARLGVVTAGFFKLLIPFLCIVPGMAAAFILNIDPETESDTAFAGLTRTLLPGGYGLVGIVMAGLVAGILSTIDSMMNSTATLFTFDIYKKYIGPKTSELGLVWVGRFSMMGMVGLAIWLSLYFGQTRGGIFNTMADYNAYLVPGVIVAYVAGILQPFVTPSASFITIIAGPLLSIGFEQGAKYGFGHQLQAFHRAGLATIGCYIVLVIVSLITASERNADRELYTWHRFKTEGTKPEARPRPLWQSDKLWAAILVACTLWMCWFFA